MTLPRDRLATRRALGGFLALACAMGIGRFAYTPVLPAMLAERALDLAGAGLVASANFVGYLVGALLASRGPFARQRASTVIASALASAPTTAPRGVVDGFAAWCVMRFVSGIASALLLVCGSSLFIEAFSAAARPLLNAVPYAGVGVGIALSALLVHAVSAHGGSADAMWWLLGALALAMGAPGAVWLAGGERTATRETRRPVASEAPAADAVPPAGVAAPARHVDPPHERRATRALRWLTFAYGLLGLGYVITATFIVVMVRALPDGRAYETAVWVATGVAAIPSNVLWYAAARRWGDYRAMVAAYLLEAIGVAASGLSPGLAGAFAGGVLLGGTFMAITALTLPVGRALSGGGTRAIGRLTVAFSIGQIVGPAVGGVIAQRAGGFVETSLLAAAVLAVAAAATARAARLAAPLPRARGGSGLR